MYDKLKNNDIFFFCDFKIIENQHDVIVFTPYCDFKMQFNNKVDMHIIGVTINLQ